MFRPEPLGEVPQDQRITPATLSVFPGREMPLQLKVVFLGVDNFREGLKGGECLAAKFL
jgi:hypothetical protein